MRSFEEIPRLPLTRLLGQIFATGARRYEMREMQARTDRELGPVAVMGRGRFTNVFLFGPDANRAELLDRADSLSSREPWMLIMGTIFPTGLLLRDGAEHRHHRKIMHEAFKRKVLREYARRMNPAIERSLDEPCSRRAAPRPRRTRPPGRPDLRDAGDAAPLPAAASHPAEAIDPAEPPLEPPAQ